LDAEQSAHNAVTQQYRCGGAFSICFGLLCDCCGLLLTVAKLQHIDENDKRHPSSRNPYAHANPNNMLRFRRPHRMIQEGRGCGKFHAKRPFSKMGGPHVLCLNPTSFAL
jgi:hypothetical protein